MNICAFTTQPECASVASQQSYAYLSRQIANGRDYNAVSDTKQPEVAMRGITER